MLCSAFNKIANLWMYYSSLPPCIMFRLPVVTRLHQHRYFSAFLYNQPLLQLPQCFEPQNQTSETDLRQNSFCEIVLVHETLDLRSPVHQNDTEHTEWGKTLAEPASHPATLLVSIRLEDHFWSSMCVFFCVSDRVRLTVQLCNSCVEILPPFLAPPPIQCMCLCETERCGEDV